VLYLDSSHVSVVMLEWSEIMDSYNTPDTAVRDRQQKKVVKYFVILVRVGFMCSVN